MTPEEAVRAINVGGPKHKYDHPESSFDPLLRESEVLRILANERQRLLALMAQASSDNLEDGRTCLPTRVAAEIVEPGR